MLQNVHVFDLPGKNLMLAFESDSKEECIAFNAAINEVCKENDLMPFHQISGIGGDPTEPGFHGWEMWAKVTEETLNSLIPLIEERANKLIEMWW